MTDDKNKSDIGNNSQELDYFIRLANKTCNEALQNLEEPLRFLSSIDALFMNFIQELMGIQPATAGLLLINAHASFRAALRLAFSGQLLPVFMTLRGVIESSLYAHAIVKKPDLQKVWLERANDKTSRKKCRDSFTIGKMFNYLECAHEKSFADYVREHYDYTIDFGAHPNMHSVVKSASLKDLVDGNIQLSFAYLHSHESFEVRQSLIAILPRFSSNFRCLIGQLFD